jgi:hypothetical protein
MKGETLHDKILMLKKKGMLELRCTYAYPPITPSLFDGKEAPD